MRKILIIFLLQFFNNTTFAQEKLRATEGWGDRSIVILDTVTPLNKLISRLDSNWKFVSTGKAYWIGYIDDMYSIARHGDTAVNLLLNFINNDTSHKARIGALYTLHLIGTNSTVTGRFSEIFNNNKARQALLQLLNREDLQTSAMQLLARDPKTSDVRYIMEAMINSKTDCWSLVNGLLRYDLSSIPIHQELPHRIWSIQFSIQPRNPGILQDSIFEAQVQEALNSIRNLKTNSISIEDTLFHSKINGGGYSILDSLLTINIFLSRLTDVDYVDLGSKIQYYFENDHLYICSPKTAKQRWINWWKKRKDDLIFN